MVPFGTEFLPSKGYRRRSTPEREDPPSSCRSQEPPRLYCSHVEEQNTDIVLQLHPRQPSLNQLIQNCPILANHSTIEWLDIVFPLSVMGNKGGALIRMGNLVRELLFSPLYLRRNVRLICFRSISCLLVWIGYRWTVTCVICCSFHTVAQPGWSLGLDTVRIKSNKTA